MKKLSTLVAAVLLAGPAAAQDFIVYGGAKLEFTHDEGGPGTGMTTDLSGYVEAELDGFYAGIWALTTNDNLAQEFDLYLGYRNEIAAGLSYDISYARYFYPNDGGNCCGELGLSLGMPLGDQLSVSADMYYDPDAEIGSAYVGTAFAATDALEVSANYGTYQVDGASNEQEWDLGATYYVGEETAFDVRYYDGSEYAGSYFGLSLTWDSTLFGG
jgi:uncharacterized protein (TIGR02001 family)